MDDASSIINSCQYTSASEVTTLRRYTNLFIIIIIKMWSIYVTYMQNVCG